MRLIATIFLLKRRILKKIKSMLLASAFKKHGKNVVFDPDDIFSYSTIEIGNDVFIGSGAEFVASKSYIRIGNKVMFGPNVTIRGGTHNIEEVGRYMYDVKEKRLQDDQGVIIEDDVWVGSRAVILRGVTLGRGCVVGAGAIVTKSILPYAVVIGIPARVSKMRFGLTSILEHERVLYPKDQRFSEQELKTILGDFLNS